ncbi:peptide chain release factor N(5)-glutamine methyltransferase [Thiohalobacter sp. IOR34]|uniref:peptide chain release factor N(5)-glutamine methyltransferase n=1 Tax=Thiohalobacter sp. IOR34 TaxID=3057176 RepID=UPI0025AF06E9|nr:peptide chain release factor N(5)-glutamine methyltransferase [Thiohalobacter sp. IOR34]WJW75944.1 peptide chain release factor N(5)-glutamine methyltransferase [Thiohalobacter sp. IOR34]
MTTIKEALAEALSRLDTESPRLDAEVLLAFALGQPRSHLLAWPDKPLDAETAARFATLIERRAAGEPVAHLTGRREFWSMELEVTADTLIPRPETETLVEQALLRIPADAAWRIADLGSGSGAIALAIARERPGCRIVGVERSAAALAVAERNRARLGLAGVEFRQGDWFTPLAGERFEMLLANPPYIAEGDPHLERGDVRFEPRSALTAGSDGLDDIRHLVEAAPAYLKTPGWLLLEQGADQAGAVRQLLAARGYRELACHPDGAGRPRVSAARHPGH